MSASLASLSLPLSILDTDLYKLSMQQAVLRLFPDTPATYRFTNRSADILFSRQCIERFRSVISHFSTIVLTEDESDWLRQACPYFTEEYIAFLSSYRFKPEQVKVKYIPVTGDNLQGKVEIDVIGPWVETILWEVPLMAALSESYFQTVATDWSYDKQDEIAYAKATQLIQANCHFSEFGTRRRRSFQAQDIVVQALVRASKDNVGRGALAGTSNGYFAQKYNLKPIGTIAHEWFMGVAALKGYENANAVSLKLWEEVYDADKAPLISLTDTFTTSAFIKDILADPELAYRWHGLRHDSGDPFEYAVRVKEMYQSLGIPHANKSLIFSDSLNVQKCIEIQKHCDELGFQKVSFGIGTFLTNDFRTASGEKSKALNIVVKLSSVGDKPCVKLSDDLGKNTGNKETIEHVKRMYGLI